MCGTCRKGEETGKKINKKTDVYCDFGTRRGSPHNGLYGEAPPGRGTFFRLQVYKRVGISQV